IDVEDLTKHKTDSVQMNVSKEACDIVNKSKEVGHKVCAVGATVLRAIETAVGPGGFIKEFDGWTNKFIFPPYDFTVADAFVVNFQMPLTTMLMLVSAFGGYDVVMDAYKQAIAGEYKFGTYGDAMLIID
nr:S-adenosylmethionine:tRNA ribosyltransferase-isomerase [Bacteroidaceae bacterium]